MRISHAWISEFVDLQKITPEELGELLTVRTAEFEGVIDIAQNFEKVFWAQLTAVKPHPQSDQYFVGQFDLGKKLGNKQIVIGNKHPVVAGKLYPIAIDGAHLMSGMKIEPREVKGITSEGMICDNIELGCKNEELLETNDKELVGENFAKIYSACGDSILDIDNKSLTHRPDLMGHRGFVRESAAITHREYQLPEPAVALEKSAKNFDVQIQTDKCSRFCGARVNNVLPYLSEANLLFRLEALGIRAINNLVDITNLILLEFGQPMHVFDADKIEGDIIVRMAKKGESLLALDGNEYELCPEDIVIADKQKVLSVAGIMGGMESSVTNKTKNIIFESACFDATSVRKTSQRLGLRSESSLRFEKSLDPHQSRISLLSAIEQLLNICPEAQPQGDIVDNFPNPPAPVEIEISHQHIINYIGVDIDKRTIQTLLESIDFKVAVNDSIFKIIVPSYRATKDVQIAEDIIEEVARLYGLENIPATLPESSISPAVKNIFRYNEWKIRDFFAARGFLETYQYSFFRPDPNIHASEENYLSLKNPISQEYTHLRVTLAPGIFQHIESELRSHQSLSFFEIGRVYHPQKSEILPNEQTHLLVLRGDMTKKSSDLYYEIKSELDAFFQFSMKKPSLQKHGETIKYLHPFQSADIFIEDIKIGHIGTLHPKVNPVRGSSIAFFELDISTWDKEIITEKYKSLSLFPVANRDISLVVEADILAQDIEKTALATTPMLVDIQIFDDFTDNGKLKGKRNLSFHLAFQSPERSLKDAEVEEAFIAIIKNLKKEHHAFLRLDFDAMTKVE